MCSANPCCGNFSTDKCSSCRTNICRTCSKRCPLNCNLATLCERCEQPDKHGCYAKVLHELRNESRATLEALALQHMEMQKTANATIWMQISFRRKHCAAQNQPPTTGYTEDLTSMTCPSTPTWNTSTECAGLARHLEVTSCSSMRHTTRYHAPIASKSGHQPALLCSRLSNSQHQEKVKLKRTHCTNT